MVDDFEIVGWWVYRGVIPPDKLKFIPREQTKTLGTR
jgi:hypothetical protein